MTNLDTWGRKGRDGPVGHLDSHVLCTDSPCLQEAPRSPNPYTHRTVWGSTGRTEVGPFPSLWRVRCPDLVESKDFREP